MMYICTFISVQEQANLGLLKESLNKSEQLTQNMVCFVLPNVADNLLHIKLIVWFCKQPSTKLFQIFDVPSSITNMRSLLNLKWLLIVKWAIFMTNSHYHSSLEFCRHLTAGLASWRKVFCLCTERLLTYKEDRRVSFKNYLDKCPPPPCYPFCSQSCFLTANQILIKCCAALIMSSVIIM